MCSLGGRGVWGRMDTHICIYESVCCSPEIITTLLIGCTPIPNKKALWDSSKSNFPERLFFFGLLHISYWIHTLWFRFKEICIAEIIYCRCNIHWKDWYWSQSANTLSTWCKEPSHWKRPWCWEWLKAAEKRVTENEMVGWHHRLNGHEFEQTPGESEGQGSLMCCRPWGRKESDTTGCRWEVDRIAGFE